MLTPDQARDALAIRDLTDPHHGPHAMQLLLDRVERAVRTHTGITPRRHRTSPVVPVADNYDRLGYARDAAARDARYSRYLTDGLMLRAHTTAAVPALLRTLPDAPDQLLSVPGLAYRRDAIDRLHVGEPHQLDLWRVRRDGPPLTAGDLVELVTAAVRGAVPGADVRLVPADHPYTVDGREIRVGSVEVGECGLADPALLARCGVTGSGGANASGLAVGLGLDRLLMLAKGIDDIRLLRATDPRIAGQLQDLAPYRPVSQRPPVRRDLSIAVPTGTDAEQLGDAARAALGERAAAIEALEVIAETPYGELPAAARDRLGIAPDQKNLLVRIVLRDLDRTLTDAEANVLRDRMYAALHRGYRPVAGGC